VLQRPWISLPSRTQAHRLSKSIKPTTLLAFLNRHKWKLLLVLFLLSIGYYFCLPKQLFNAPLSTVMFAKNGELLGAKIAKDGQWRFPATDSIPQKFATAVITFEDKRFRKHWGIDIWALARAVRLNLKHQSIVSGGSTLSMQTIRLASDNPQRSLWEKLKEVVLATRLEWSYSKDEIINLWASYAPFGGNVVGIDAAAWKYFGRNAYQLSWAESAMLAVLPNSPSLIHLGRNRKKLETKRNRLLQELREQGHIDSTTYQLALLEELPNKPKPLPRLSPHLLERVHQERVLSQKSKGLIYSTLDANLQRNVNEILDRNHQMLKSNEIYNAAAIVVEVKTGDVLAYAGNVLGAAATHSPDVDIITARRSSGSILKPFLYASMIHDGEMTSKTLFPDIPSQFGSYTPQNYDKTYAGAVDASSVIIKSLNIPSVHMLKQYGIMRFADKLRQIGMTTLDYSANHYGLTLVLGGAESCLWDLGAMYAGMARNLLNFHDYNGKYDKHNYRPLNYLQENTKGQLPLNERGQLQDNTPLKASAIWHVFEAMQEVMRPGEEVFWKSFPSANRVAWKTGTSYGFRDAWAVGCTPEYVVAVWTGNADGEGRPGLVGVHAAAPILFDIFHQLNPEQEWFEPPYDEQKKLPICQQSGHIASEYCTDVVEEWQASSSEKSKICPYHRRIHLSQDGRYQVDSDCASPTEMLHKNFFVLPPAMSWYYQKKHPDYEQLPPFRADCQANANQQRKLALLYPTPNTKIYVPTELDETKSRTVFEAKHSNPAATVYWHLDNSYVGETRELHYLELNPTIGKHTITIVDENGETISRTFEILAGTAPE